jgi:hypothetical protein
VDALHWAVVLYRRQQTPCGDPRSNTAPGIFSRFIALLVDHYSDHVEATALGSAALKSAPEAAG